MGRPKASERFQSLALQFSNMITLPDPRSDRRIPYAGPSSIFAALATCLPEITRDRNDPNPVDKSAISCVELNKVLGRSGYLSSRVRHRIKGTRAQWSKGFSAWSNRRCSDPNDPEELQHIQEHLLELYCLYPETRSLTLEKIVFVLSELGQNTFNLKNSRKGNNGSTQKELTERETIQKILVSYQENSIFKETTDVLCPTMLNWTKNCPGDVETPEIPNIGGVISCRQQLSLLTSPYFAPIPLPRLPFPQAIIHSFHELPVWTEPLRHHALHLGISRRLLASILRHLPPDLADAMRAACSALHVLAAHAERRAVSRVAMAGWGGAGRAGGEAGCVEPWEVECGGFEEEELAAFELADHPVLRCTYHPASRRTTELYLNPAYCHLAGRPAPELLAAAAAHDLPQHMPEIDCLCLLIDAGMAPALADPALADAEPVQYLRWAWPGEAAGGGAQLVERRVRRVRDQGGREWRHVAFLRPVGPEEVDAVDGAGFRLQRGMGDVRGVEERLAGAAGDMRVTVEGMRRTAEGRRGLGWLAGEVGRMFGEAVGAAREHVGMDLGLGEAWARAALGAESEWETKGGGCDGGWDPIFFPSRRPE